MGNDKKRVVVVDDSRTTLLLIESLFLEIDKNIQVKLFERAGSAIKYLKAHKPDLLIIDLLMPKISGLELLQKIYPLDDTTVFMISANTRVVKIESALELGVDEYFTKPLKINLLRRKIIESLSSKKIEKN